MVSSLPIQLTEPAAILIPSPGYLVAVGQVQHSRHNWCHLLDRHLPYSFKSYFPISPLPAFVFANYQPKQQGGLWIIYSPRKNPDNMNRNKIWTRYPILALASVLLLRILHLELFGTGAKWKSILQTMFPLFHSFYKSTLCPVSTLFE